MMHAYDNPPASNQEISLYSLLGEAVCGVQHLEEALSKSITIRKVGRGGKNRARAEEVLKKYSKYTLGDAVKYAIQEKIYNPSLQESLQNFLPERNWLIHRSVTENRDDMASSEKATAFFNRIQNVGLRAFRLMQAVEVDMMNYCSVQGVDMSEVYVSIENHYNKS